MLNSSGNPPGSTSAAVSRRQRLGQRVELDDVGTRRAQQFGVLGVAEAERLARRERDGDALGRAGRRRRCSGLHGSAVDVAARRGDDAGQVDMRATRAVIASTAARALPTVLDGGHQAEMP